jgi:hypothetical protein
MMKKIFLAPFLSFIFMIIVLHFVAGKNLMFSILVAAAVFLIQVMIHYYGYRKEGKWN